MNTQHDHSDPAAGVSGASEERIHASRRRFARAGLSSTVVLGSLASKPVLGAAPYHCTVSGQASGTLSRQGAMDACRIGDAIATWQGAPATDWSASAIGMVKGSTWNSGCNFAGSPTMFNGFRVTVGGVALADTFWGNSGSGSCTMVTTTTTKPASMYQVLMTTGASGSEAELGQVVVVSLLNALKFQPNYGVTPTQVIEMFNAVRTGGPGSYSVAGRTWSRADVVGYLRLLFKA
jgi:hypothetical protein